MSMPLSSPGNDLQSELAFARKVTELTNLIHSAGSVQDIVVNLSERIRSLLGCQALTLYALDSKNQQLYSIFKIQDARQVIRIPKDARSIAGYCAVSRQTVSVEDAYDTAELARIYPQLHFDKSWDETFGFRTRQVLAVPLLMEKYLLGVLQLINKQGGDGFTPQDRAATEEIARTLAIAFYNQNRAARGAAPAAGKRHRFSALIDRGLVGEDDFEAAVTMARVRGRDLGYVLMEEHGIAREEIGRSLSDFYGLPFFAWDRAREVPRELRERVPEEFWRSNRCAPLVKRGGVLQVAAVDPFNLERIDAIKATGIAARIEIQVGLEQDVLAYLDHSFGSGVVMPGDDQEAEVGPLVEEDETGKEGEVEVDSYVVRLANRIIADAVRQGASDIHIEPYGPERPCLIRFRRDGECFRYQEVGPQHRTALVQRLKILANLDISEKRKPQDGKIRFKLASGAITELRVATVPTSGEGNEDVVMRILAASEPIPIDRLGMSPKNLARFQEIVRKPYGLVLCVGPTGSGKTTTLHSALGYINTDAIKIWTAEDPVEITQPGLRQLQVHPRIGLDFAAAMRSFLRADPDVIMLGEMRDQETAGVGIEASLTGHLVFSTLHTNSAPETITRLLDIGLDPFNFADALLGVLAQRLVRTLCQACKQAYPADPRELEELQGALGAEEAAATELGIELKPGLTLHRPQGCPDCGDSGYRGRMAIHELLIASDTIKRAIVERRPVEEIRRQAIAEGMTTLLQDGVWKVCLGHTDLKQVKTVALR